jgi:hypothetical protein
VGKRIYAQLRKADEEDPLRLVADNVDERQQLIQPPITLLSRQALRQCDQL